MSYLIPDRPIAFNRDFVRLGIGITGALFLSQIVYWSKRTKDGWFYKTADEWGEETGMSRKEQETARKRLRDAGILHEKKQGIPAKLYFYLDESKLVELMESVFTDEVKQVSTNGGNSISQKGECNTETTTENKKTSKKSASITKQVIIYLNEKSGKSFKHTAEATKRHIQARVNEGFCLEDFKRVIDHKCSEWIGDSKMEQYIRPNTLFGTKFEGYLNAAPASSDEGGYQWKW